jgi:hypothetical protein
LDPPLNFSLNIIADNDVTVVASNRSNAIRASPFTARKCLNAPNIGATARLLLGNPTREHLNAITIALTHAIADTGATSIFRQQEGRNAAYHN